MVDENLTFNEHVNDICNKLKRLFHIFYNIRDYLSKENIKTIYYALIYSRIKYGLSVYGQASNTKMKRIQTLQNQLLKVLAGKEYRFSTDKLHVEFELLKVKDIKEQEILTFVHNFFSNSLPPVFDNCFDTFDHPYQIRNGSKSIRIRNHSSEMAATSVLVKGATLWNALDIRFKNISKRKNFRAQFKTDKINSYDQTQ